MIVVPVGKPAGQDSADEIARPGQGENTKLAFPETRAEKNASKARGKKAASKRPAKPRHAKKSAKKAAPKSAKKSVRKVPKKSGQQESRSKGSEEEAVERDCVEIAAARKTSLSPRFIGLTPQLCRASMERGIFK